MSQFKKHTKEELQEAEAHMREALEAQRSRIRVVRAQTLMLKSLNSEELEGLTVNEAHRALVGLLYSYINEKSLE